jgi:hypothetical protein
MSAAAKTYSLCADGHPAMDIKLQLFADGRFRLDSSEHSYEYSIEFTASGRWQPNGHDYVLIFEKLEGSCPSQWHETGRALATHDGGRLVIEHAGYSLF